MDREILFKAKRIDNKEWVEGNFMRKNDPTKTDDVFWCCFIQDMALSMYEVMPKTVSQFTGLLDKNDNKIFEGDKVHIEYNYIGIIDVEFINGCFNISRYSLSKANVIGNIHDK